MGLAAGRPGLVAEGESLAVSTLEYLKWLWRGKTVVDQAEAAAKEAGVDAKSILLSRTFWFNVLAGAIGVCQAQGIFTAIPDPWGPLVVMLGNIALRYITTQPVKL